MEEASYRRGVQKLNASSSEKMHTEAVLRGQQVVLVPSTPDHTQKYHEWMTDPRLLKDTGTDPLTLQDVYEIERHWREDHDKLTFIILANGQGDLTSFPMVGDVNLFLKGDPSDGDFEVEVGVMIAEESYRGRGFALEALSLLLSYATASPVSFAVSSLSLVPDPPFPFPIRTDSLVARIGQENKVSIRLFERLGFIETKGANAFGEKEMRFAKEEFSHPHELVPNYRTPLSESRRI